MESDILEAGFSSFSSSKNCIAYVEKSQIEVNFFQRNVTNPRNFKLIQLYDGSVNQYGEASIKVAEQADIPMK